MSPEYAAEGIFSVKSDVFSFGVLVLEIVSGKKNWRFSHPDHEHNLLGHVRVENNSVLEIITKQTFHFRFSFPGMDTLERKESNGTCWQHA